MLAQPAVPVIITDEISDKLTESRVGGRPAWPINRPRPKAKGQFPLCFLAQINLAEMPPLEGFANTGLLQFYFAADDLYGMRFDENASVGSTTNSDILIAYHPDLDAMEEWVQFHSDDETCELNVPFDYAKWWG